MLRQFLISFGSLLLLVADGFADTNAITGQGVPLTGGWVNGGAGFSFTPTTNLAVTRVGYYDNGPLNPIIRFWADTNYLIATFQLSPGSNTGLNVFSNIASANLQLFTGQRYTVTLEDGASLVVVNVYENSFFTAPQLTNYLAQTFARASGTFAPQGTNYYFAGPNFSFSNLPAISVPPELHIASLNSTGALLSWAESPAGYVPQQNFALDTSNWVVLTNAINPVNGSNQVIVPAISNNFFRLIHP